MAVRLLALAGGALGVAPRLEVSPECPQGCPMRSWSRDYLRDVLAEPHELCRGGDGTARHRPASAVLEAVKAFPWERTFGAGRPRNLYPGSDPYPRPGELPPGVATSADGAGITYGGAKNHELAYWHEVSVLGVVFSSQLLRGRSFLEVAAETGTRCFLAETLGAGHVVCSDYHQWGGQEEADTHVGQSRGPSLPLELFRLQHCLRESKVRAVRVNVYDVQVLHDAPFDVVYAGGLFYHLKYQILGFQALAAVTRSVLIVETESVPELHGMPLCRYFRAGSSLLGFHTDAGLVPRRRCDKVMNRTLKYRCRRKLRDYFRVGRSVGELNNDTTNYFACNYAAMEGMLNQAGLELLMDLRVRTDWLTRAHYVAVRPGVRPETVACIWDRSLDCKSFWAQPPRVRGAVGVVVEVRGPPLRPWAADVLRSYRRRINTVGAESLVQLARSAADPSIRGEVPTW